MSRKIDSGRGREGEAERESWGRLRIVRVIAGVQRRQGLGWSLNRKTQWKSQRAFTRVQAAPERTQSHFSWSKNMKTEHVGGIGLASEAKSRGAAP